MSLKTMSARLGVSQKSLSAIETGRRQPPDLPLVDSMCQVLGLSASDAALLRDAISDSSLAVRIPYGATPLGYRLAHRLMRHLNRLSIQQIEEIQAILDGRASGVRQEGVAQ